MTPGFAAIETLLANRSDTGAFCHGDAPTLADLCLIPQMYNARGVELDMKPWPTLLRIEEAAAGPAGLHRRPSEEPARCGMMPTQAHARLELDRFLPYNLSVLNNRVSDAIARQYSERFRCRRRMAGDGGARQHARPFGPRSRRHARRWTRCRSAAPSPVWSRAGRADAQARCAGRPHHPAGPQCQGARPSMTRSCRMALELEARLLSRADGRGTRRPRRDHGEAGPPDRRAGRVGTGFPLTQPSSPLTTRIASALGPWAPSSSVCSMSPVREGPVTKLSVGGKPFAFTRASTCSICGRISPACSTAISSPGRKCQDAGSPRSGGVGQGAGFGNAEGRARHRGIVRPRRRGQRVTPGALSNRSRQAWCLPAYGFRAGRLRARKMSATASAISLALSSTRTSAAEFSPSSRSA